MKLQLFDKLEVWESDYPIWKPGTSLVLEINEPLHEDFTEGERFVRLSGKLVAVACIRDNMSDEEIRALRHKMVMNVGELIYGEIKQRLVELRKTVITTSARSDEVHKQIDDLIRLTEGGEVE